MAGTGYLRGDYETTVGSESNSSPTLSSKSIYIPGTEAELALNPTVLERDDELRGVDEPIAVLEEFHRPTWRLRTRTYPDALGFLLKSQLGAPTTTAGNGVITDANGVVVPTGAYRHTWTAPFGPAGTSPQTTQWRGAYADNSTFFKLQGAAVESSEFTVAEQGGVGLIAQGPATYLTRISDPSLTASYEALTIPPFLRAHLSISHGLSGTASGHEGDCTFRIDSPLEAVSDYSSASRFPSQMYKGDTAPTLSGTITKSSVDPEDWDALKAATGFTLAFTLTSTATIASSYPYKAIIKCLNAQYMEGGPEPLAAKRRLKADFTWRSTYAGSAGSSTLQVVNATSAYT